MKNSTISAIIAIAAIVGFSMSACSSPVSPGKAPPALTGTVGIMGTAQVGQTLTANTSALDGSGDLSYQWKRGSTAIGSNSDTYTIVAADAGFTITVTVTRSGYSGGVTSDPTAVVTDQALPPLTGMITISGTAQAGQTLAANTGGLNGSGTITYQWKRGTTNIGANSSTYTIGAADVGFTITVTVTRSGFSGGVTSDPTAMVTDPSLPDLTGTVTISGVAIVGETLTANTTNLGGSGTITYQWKRGTTDIGANSSTYTITAADVGFTITLTVTRSGYLGSITSDPTAAVINPTPVAGDYDIGNLTQTTGSVTGVTITPKAGKSSGAITIYYDTLTTLPTAAGTYTVTFDVAAAAGWNAASGLAGGTLTIANAGISIGNAAIKLFLDGGPLENGEITTLSQSSGDFNVSIASGTYTEIIWYLNGAVVARGAARTAITLPRETPGAYQITVEAAAGGIKNSGSHSLVIQ